MKMPSKTVGRQTGQSDKEEGIGNLYFTGARFRIEK